MLLENKTGVVHTGVAEPSAARVARVSPPRSPGVLARSACARARARGTAKGKGVRGARGAGGGRAMGTGQHGR